jgi:drug/metabolite transporter (DMT)-like permease
MNSHLKGLIITTFGVLFVVPDSLFVRLIDAEPLVTAFWRGMIAGLIILFAVPMFQGLNGFSAVLRTGRAGIFYTLVLGTTAPAFVMAITHTSVANAVFIFAATPVFAAMFSRIFLGEPVRLRMVLTMLVVMIGLGIIAYGSGSTGVASWQGDLWALYVSMAFAAALTAVRKVKDTSMIPVIPIAYIGAALIVGSFVSPLTAFEAQWPLFLAHGAFIAAATCLLTLGPRYISSAEVSLLILLESVLAPLLAWAVIGEDPGRWALIGGAVVIGALLASNLLALWPPRREQS